MTNRDLDRSSIMLFLFLLIFLQGAPVEARTSFPKPPFCQVRIMEVLEAEIFRGPPYLAQILARDPEHAQMFESESHGDHHLACTYKVLLNQRLYRYKEEIPNTLLELKVEDCNREKIKRMVKEEVIQFTSKCEHPDAIPVWGEPLKPLS